MKKANGDFLKNKNGSYKYSSMDSETIRIAGMIRNNRQNEQDKANIYSEAEAELLKAKERSKGDFIQYFKGAVNLVAEKSAA